MKLDPKKYSYTKNKRSIIPKLVLLVKTASVLVFIDKRCIFAPLINRGRVPQNLITRLCQ